MTSRVDSILEGVNTLAAIRARGEPFLPCEEELYKELAGYAVTLVRFQNVCSQAALLKAERDLHAGLQERGRDGPHPSPSAT